MTNVHNQPSRIILIGMMGCGKTTIGRGLAESLKLPFVDLDEAIEKRTQRTINDIFEKEGEFAFRACEAQILRDLPTKYPRTVLATGGGTPLHFDNIRFLNANGLTIFLDIDTDVLLARLAKERDNRPLLARDDWETYLRGLTEQRRSSYKAAHITVKIEADDSSVGIDQILEQLPQLVII